MYSEECYHQEESFVIPEKQAVLFRPAELQTFAAVSKAKSSFKEQSFRKNNLNEPILKGCTAE